MINSKTITVGLSIGVPTIIGLYKMLTNQSDIKNIYHKFVGIEINETNYNVAIGEAIINNKGQITDFRITKRKNGMIHEDIYKSF